MRKDHLQCLREAQEGRSATDTCTWYDCAVEVLRLDMGVYAKAVFYCLEEGRRKERNVTLIGSANTVNTFMLKPLYSKLTITIHTLFFLMNEAILGQLHHYSQHA